MRSRQAAPIPPGGAVADLPVSFLPHRTAGAMTGKRQVIVAVDAGTPVQEAFKWALENLLRPGDHLALVNVRHQKGTAIPGKSGNDRPRAGNRLFPYSHGASLFEGATVTKHVLCIASLRCISRCPSTSPRWGAMELRSIICLETIFCLEAIAC